MIMITPFQQMRWESPKQKELRENKKKKNKKDEKKDLTDNEFDVILTIETRKRGM